MNTVKLELDDAGKGNFFLYVEDKKAGEMEVEINNETLTVYHTGISAEHEGKGYAKLLLDAMVAEARKRKLQVVPLCVYVHAQFRKHPDEYADIWTKAKH